MTASFFNPFVLVKNMHAIESKCHKSLVSCSRLLKKTLVKWTIYPSRISLSVTSQTLLVVQRKILTGEILTNLMNSQQFINIFPIKIFHLVNYLPLINLWQSGSTRRKIISLFMLLSFTPWLTTCLHY